MSGPTSFIDSMTATALLRALGDPVFVLDDHARVCYANAEAELLIGRAKQSLVGKPFEDLVSEDDLIALTGIASTLGAAVERNLSIFLKQSEDSCVQVNATISRLAASSDGTTGYILTCRDAGRIQEILSESSRMAAEEAERADLEARARGEAEQRERRQTEEAQARKLESIGQLAAGVAHEINTPIQFMSDNLLFLRDSATELLSCIRACNTLLETAESRPASEVLKDLTRAIAGIELAYLAEELPSAFAQTLDGAHRVAKIVRAMKDFAHPSNGQRGQLDLREAIDTTVTLARSEWREVAGVEVESEPELGLVTCVADEFKQVILNMLVNACHAIEDRMRSGDTKRGEIKIRAHQVEHCAEIRITDNGVGIPQENLGRIFDPFFTTKEVGRGTGQGLALAYTTIVRRHAGEICVESTLGEGTTFIVRIPLKGPSEHDAETRAARDDADSEP